MTYCEQENVIVINKSETVILKKLQNSTSI